MKGINKAIKIVTIVMIAIMLISLTSNVFAAKVGVDPSGFTGTAQDIDTKDVTKWSNNIINIVAIVGSAASIVILIVLGVKYMLGSAEEKAEYKKTLLPYIIGAVFVFGASALTGVIYNMVGK